MRRLRARANFQIPGTVFSAVVLEGQNYETLAAEGPVESGALFDAKVPRLMQK